MRRSIEILLGEVDTKLTGYACLLNYRYMNLCIVAEPMSLLSITIADVEGNEYHIEDMASTMQPDEFTFEIVPHDITMIPNIQEGIAKVHPEFKQEVIKPKDEDRFFMPDTPNYDKERHIICRMPEVDNNRYDVLKEAVKTLYDECKVDVEKIKGKYTQLLADRTKELPAEEADEAKKEMGKMMDQYSETINTYRDNKLKEIEESHQKWIADRAEEKLKLFEEKNQ
jgi:ribosome recycling factor